MMIFTHKSVKIHMLGNKVKNCPDGEKIGQIILFDTMTPHPPFGRGDEYSCILVYSTRLKKTEMINSCPRVRRYHSLIVNLWKYIFQLNVGYDITYLHSHCI